MFFKNSLKVSYLGGNLPSPLLLFLLKLPHPPPPLQEALLGTVAAQVQHLIENSILLKQDEDESHLTVHEVELGVSERVQQVPQLVRINPG